MPPQQSSAVVKQVPVSVIIAREPVSGNRWIDERWKVAAIRLAESDTPPGISRTLLYQGPEGERYLWRGFVLRLHSAEADGYFYNVIGQKPQLYVYCEQDDSGEPRPRWVTAEYSDAMSNVEADNATFSVPMSPEIFGIVEQFAREHYVPEESKQRRKRERQARREGHWQDE